MARGKHGNHAGSSQHHRWSDDKLLSSHGYVKVRVGTDHPIADPNGYAYEHLIVWVAAGRREPDKGEILHHRNDDKADNRLENIELMTRAQHNRHHNEQRGRCDCGCFLSNDGSCGKCKRDAGRELDGRTHDEWPITNDQQGAA